MSTVEKPSEQLQLLLDSHKDYAAGDFKAFADRYAEDFTRENLPTSMKWPGRDNLGESSKAEFLASMQFARTNIYKDNFDISVTEVVEQPGKFVIFGLMTASTTLELSDPFVSEIVMLVDVRRESDGKLRITRIKEFLDSVSMAKFSEALAKKFAAGLPVPS